MRTLDPRRARVAAALTVLSVVASLARPVPAASCEPARGSNGMVSSPEAHATRVGVEVLRSGGNAVDAAVAVAVTLAVTYPRAGNLAGGGFLLYRDPEGGYHALDHRETAPAALDPADFLDEQGRVDPTRSRRGGLAVGVPGSVAGLAEAHRRFGSMPWKDLFAPAVRLAAEGFPISRTTARSFAERNDRLSADPEARRIFTRDGQALREGDRLVQPDLAATLSRLAEEGPDAFYGGPIAEAIVATVVAHGGVLRTEDLADYRAVWRDPLSARYRGHRVVSFPPPSSGGLVLLEILEMLERFDLRSAGYGASSTVHRFVEASRRAYADRARWMGDPDRFDVPVQGLLSPEYLRARSSSIREDRADRSSDLGPGRPPVEESPDTLHFSIVDARGAAVSWTTTLNSAYGSGIVATGTGMLLNNEIDDFALAPGVPNQFGLVGGEANAVAGGKRPLSSMTPTIVESPDGTIRLVLGAPGGSRIISSVAQVILNVLEFDMGIQEAVDAPRVHHQWIPDVLYAERFALPEDVRRNLEARGHDVRPYGTPSGLVTAIAADPQGGWQGAADPRGEGTAEGW